MATKEYEHAQRELDTLIALNKALSETNTKILEGNEVLAELLKQSKIQHENIIPVTRGFVKDLIEIRMSFGREVLDMLKSARELSSIAKSAPDIIKYVEAVERLKSLLTPEMIKALSSLVKSQE